jgi:PilZ domain
VSQADRRQDSRAFVQLSVGLTTGAGGEELNVSSLNVSAGGVYVQVPHFIEPLTKLALVLDIPGPTPNDEAVRIETEAIVVRTSPESADADTKLWEVACAFLNLQDEHRDTINRYVLTHRAASPA